MVVAIIVVGAPIVAASDCTLPRTLFGLVAALANALTPAAVVLLAAACDVSELVLDVAVADIDELDVAAVVLAAPACAF